MPLDASQVRARLPNRQLAYFSSIRSTMFEAARLAAEAAPAGTLVVAEEQTAGQGRHGRCWHSERESGLYVSIILRPEPYEDALQVITLTVGLAVQEAVADATGVNCTLRWPNDVLAGGRKCAGILCQTAGGAVIAGIGINVNQTSFPPALSDTATSLLMASGVCPSREDLLVRLAERVDWYCGRLAAEGAGVILRLFAERARNGIEGTRRGGSRTARQEETSCC
jgi:BirA family biotin operon repressor/biotin-[acetyl-CoA-carboxylase] ligase